MTPQQIVNISEFEAYRQELYELKGNGTKAPQTNGVLDPRMGTSDKGGSCGTCHMSMAECVGHYAYIKLVLPVYHIGYFRACITMLQDICKVGVPAMLWPVLELTDPSYLRLVLEYFSPRKTVGNTFASSVDRALKTCSGPVLPNRSTRLAERF